MNTIYPTLHQALKMKRQKSFLGKVRNTSQRLKTAAQELWQDLTSIIWWSRCKKAVPKKYLRTVIFFWDYIHRFICFCFFVFLFLFATKQHDKSISLVNLSGEAEATDSENEFVLFRHSPPTNSLTWYDSFIVLYIQAIWREKAFAALFNKGRAPCVSMWAVGVWMVCFVDRLW